ncbi:MAG: hypothetical protein METHAR1v1_830008 [Methanothrix sp.]|jgi:hypothetical protein|nr:MAG: hypothetical protein METHAR1v1_830008 [Methanothrix sp.]
MKTIKLVFQEFLNEQEAQLKPRTYRGYEEAISLFEDCLDGYGWNSLNQEEADLYDELYDEGKEFCEIFGPDKITSSEIAEFLDYFMIRKVAGSNTLMETVGRVIRKFVRWMGEKGYMDSECYEGAAMAVDELKGDLAKVTELSALIFDYIRESPDVEFEEIEDGYFSVVAIKPGELWVEGYIGQTGLIGPVIVSEKISSICKEGWVISLMLGKVGESWRMIESGFVYQR